MKELTAIRRQQLDAYASFVESIVEELRKIPAEFDLDAALKEIRSNWEKELKDFPSS